MLGLSGSHVFGVSFDSLGLAEISDTLAAFAIASTAPVLLLRIVDHDQILSLNRLGFTGSELGVDVAVEPVGRKDVFVAEAIRAYVVGTIDVEDHTASPLEWAEVGAGETCCAASAFEGRCYFHDPILSP
jgi:hypothetical protein